MAKRKPAIGGLHSQGIADDIIKAVGKGIKAVVKGKKKSYVPVHPNAAKFPPPRPPVRTKAQYKELQKRLAEAKAKSMAATAVPRPPRVGPLDVEKMAAAKAANAKKAAAKKPRPPMPPPPRPPKKK
jgi:hypothetical protein